MDSPPPTDPTTFQVALAQIEPKLGDVRSNLTLHLELVAEAKKAGADLVVFPELSLTGYYLRDHVTDVSERADSDLHKAIVDAADGCAVVYGFVEESPRAGFYNAAAFADQKRIVAIHRKVYLPTYGMFDERRYFAAGDRIRAFDTRFGRVGLLICEDAWHLSYATILFAEGVDLVIMIANSPSRGVSTRELGSRASWDLLTRTYAQFLGAPVIFVNRSGYEDGVNFWGGSRAVDASGFVTAEAPATGPALVAATIDRHETRRRRIQAPLARDERLDLTIRELERIRRERSQDEFYV